MFVRSLIAATFVLAFSTASAGAANLLVDDDTVECPAAGFNSVQAAVNAASDGDTVVICPGSYVEGSGNVGTNALTITKSIDLRGAGADLVSIMPKRNPSIGGRIASGTPKLRDGLGNIVAITGLPASPTEVNISGITVEGNGVFAETGIIFLDAHGSVVRSRVTDIVTSEQAGAFGIPGGFRGSDTGYGIVQTTAATSPPAGGEVARPLLIETTRVDRYNKTGILIDSATSDVLPLTPAGVNNQGTIVGSTVVGRLRCIDFNVDGNCSSPGTITTGPLFGQDGLKVTAGASVVVDSSSFFQNFVNGENAPVLSLNTVPNSTNNANLSLAAGLRLIGAEASTITRSNISDNHYGAFNVGLDGATANTATPLSAENNWWGIRTSGTTVNSGPAVSPTVNPAEQENPVNGGSIVDPTCIAASFAATPAPDAEVPGSDAVDFCPFRNGGRSSSTGQFAISDAPLPISDAGPTVTLSFDKTEYQRGETAVLTADPQDDFALKGVTFYRGAQVIGTAKTPPYRTEIAIPADAACETTTYGVIAEDSIGQTESGTADLTVVDPVNDCEEPQPPLGPAPTITLDVPAETPNEGSTATASVTAGEGVKSVTFFLGTRELCSVTAAPYTCSILPTGADVGGQAVRAVVTDNVDRSAEASNNTYVAKFTPHLNLKVKRANAKKRTISGFLALPERVTAAQACASGTVTLAIKGGGRPAINRQVAVKANCSYKTTISVGNPPKKKKGKKPKKRKFTVKANYGGNSVLNTATNSRRFS